MSVTTAAAGSSRATRRPVRQRPVPEMGFYRTRVRSITRIGTQLRRVTVTGPDLFGFRSDGPDQRIKLLLPRPGQTEPRMPEQAHPDGWYAAWRAAPPDIRPILRTYTIRRARPALGEADIDFLLHADGGPGSTWAANAEVGDLLVFYGPYADHEPTPGTDWQLIAGDTSALPAIGAILETLSPGTRARVFVESADDDLILGFTRDVAAVRDDPGLVTWVRPGQCLADAVRGAELPEGRPYVWIGSEAGSVRELRRHLIDERGVSRGDIYFCGYWRRGRTEDYAAAHPEPDED